MEQDFYIGYEPDMPSALAPRIRVAAVTLVVVALALAGVLAAAQSRFAAGRFDYGHEQSFEGQIVERPYPGLEVSARTGDVQWYWLVGPGKHGAADLVKGLEGRFVRVSGTLVERDGDRMIEVVPASLMMTTSRSSLMTRLRAVGPAALEGEIVDSKCHLGVMKPGEGPTHRDCAVRCLFGRIPPMLVIRAGRRTSRVPLVAGDAAAFSDALPSLVGRPVRVRGTLLERAGRQFLVTSVPGIEILRVPSDVPQR